uniref:RRM domain-containing protein n=1 Tax=Aegilops tauschii subsp. strangulata TaxID=200361 RepID=A0A453S6U0_AEGTS
VVDCRICGDPNSVMRFAFIEFADDGRCKSSSNAWWNHSWFLSCQSSAI